MRSVVKPLMVRCCFRSAHILGAVPGAPPRRCEVSIPAVCEPPGSGPLRVARHDPSSWSDRDAAAPGQVEACTGSRSTFYPCRRRVPNHTILNAPQAHVEHFRNGPIFASGQRKAWTPGVSRASSTVFDRRRCSSVPWGQVLVSAPSGSAPVCRYFHSSIASPRARATIPMRRKRLPPPAYFCWNRRVSALAGW